MLNHRVPLSTDIPADEQREQLRQIVTDAAFEVKGDCLHCAGSGHSDTTTRKIVHCFSPSGFGADWALDRVLAAIDAARHMRWTNDITGHNLVVSIDGEPYRFQVKRPEQTGSAA